MDMANQLIAIFCGLDDFCKNLQEINQHAQTSLLEGLSKA